jgi:hypothetical protein
MSNKIELSPQSVEYKTIKVGAKRACFSAGLERLAITSVFTQSVRAAVEPLNAVLKELHSIKACELTDAERRKIECTCDELEAFGKRLRKSYNDCVQHVLSLKDEFDIKTN